MMTTATINVQVDSDTATLFASAPEEDRNKLSSLWGVLVHEYQGATAPLQKVMDELGGRANSRGLTPDTLAAILDDE
jgi:hypothetical protein